MPKLYPRPMTARGQGRGQRPRLQGAGLPSKARLKPVLQILHFIQELRPDLRKVLHYEPGKANRKIGVKSTYCLPCSFRALINFRKK